MRFKNASLKFFHLILSAIVILSIVNSCKVESDLSYLQNIIQRIADRLVPDHREGIAEITISSSGDRKKALILKGETDCQDLKQQVIDSLTAEGYNVIDSLTFLPSINLGEYKYGVVSLSVINLRKNPEQSAELASQAVMGTPVKLLKNEDSWILIQTPDRYIAWAERSSLQLMSDSDLKKWKESPKLIFIENSGWIYESSSEKAVVGDLVAGCMMKSNGSSEGYERVILPDGREGYVRKNSVFEFERWTSDTLCIGNDILKVASTMTGLPYMWGGSSTKAVDCSGFVQTVYFLNRIILSRDASLQAIHGLKVDIADGWSELQTGDLLFFGTVRNSKPRVTHVAIYKGDSEFIHSAGRVMVNSLDSTRTNFSSYRKNTLLSARRIIGSVGTSGIVAVKDHDWY
jgi:gamma-D-glutamyl-L-lysine dipeptidyl-peptidase